MLLRGEHGQGVRLLAHSLEDMSGQVASNHEDFFIARRNLVLGLQYAGEDAEALREARSLFQESMEHFGVDHETTIREAVGIAELLCAEGEYDEALEFVEFVSASPKESPSTKVYKIRAVIQLAKIKRVFGEYTEAKQFLR